MRQPTNVIAPWRVITDSGGYVGIDEKGLVASQAIIDKLYFSDGSSMTTAGSGLPSNIDSGTF